MKSLRHNNRFIVTTKKLSAIIDFASSSTKVKGKSDSEQSIKKCCVDTGFINEIDVRPNIYGVMKARKVYFY